MSLFDVIRYPISDIFHKGEMGRLPREIAIPWLEECYDFLGNNDPNIKTAVSASTWVRILLARAAIEHEPTGRDEYIETLKSYFTMILHRRIREHE